ncbi:sugar kinase [Acidothermaceae bacterium B102]|nr:sugar kinase [Acidothermaceae bacterium B102]
MSARPAYDLLVLGELNPDVVVSCGPADLRFGQAEQLIDAASLTLGSSGAITAAAAAAQGLRVAFCGVVGDDPLGALTVDLLAALGVDTAGVVVRAGMSTGMTVVLSAADGDRALLTYPGTMGELGTADLLDAPSARHLHTSSFYLQTALQADLPAMFARARAAGATTSLDPGWDPKQGWSSISPALAAVDYLLPNTAEVEAIAGESTPLAAARVLQQRGPAVAVKQGGDGALLVTSGGAYELRTAPVVPVDTTGAGDNFNAGFIAGLLEGGDARTALARAVASGTVAVGGWGGTGLLADRETAVRAAALLTVHPLQDNWGTRASAGRTEQGAS